MSISKTALAVFYLLNSKDSDSKIIFEEYLKVDKAYKRGFARILEDKPFELKNTLNSQPLAEKVYKAMLNPPTEFVERLEKQNVGLLCKYDENFPQLLDKALGVNCPPYLYCYGDVSFLNEEATGLIGQANADAHAYQNASAVGEKVGENEGVLICTGQTGCDEVATHRAIKSNARVIWITPKPFSAVLKDAQVASWVADGRLTLISPVNPFGEYCAKAVLECEKYMFAISKSAYVVKCSSQISSTYASSLSCLKHSLTTLYVYNTGTNQEKALIQNGGVEVK